MVIRVPASVVLVVAATSLLGVVGGIAGCKAPAGGESDPASTETSTDDTTNGGGTVEVGDEELNNGTDTNGNNGTESLEGGEVDMVVQSSGTLALPEAGLLLADAVGQAAVTDDPATNQLESLQYRISSIQICEDVETNGSGFSNTKNCVSIYDAGPGGMDGYETFGYDEAKADTENYIDLLDPESVKKLSSKLKLTDKQVGEYNFGLINWFKPFKVKGSVRLTDGTTLYTKDAPLVTVTQGNDNFERQVSQVDNITTGPAELAILQHNNGGAWFKFGKPFKITLDDIKQKRNFKLDLIFNPDGIVKASNKDGGAMRGGAKPFADLTDSDQRYSIDVPMIGLTPLAHKKDDVVVKEKYLVHYHETYNDFFPPNPAITEGFDIRVELYSLKNDPEKTVFGADIQVLYTDETTRAFDNIYDPFFVSQEDGEVVLKTYDEKPIFKGFKRLAAAGDTGSLKIVSGGGGYCLPSDMHPTDGCPDTAREYQVSYTFVGAYELP